MAESLVSAVLDVPLNAGVVYPVDNITTKLVEEHYVEKTGTALIKIEDPEIALQTYYDSLFPFASTEIQEYDEHLIETTDLNVYVSNVRIDINKLCEFSDATIPFYIYKARLRTNQPGLRIRTARQTLIALSKRNCDAPRNALPTDMSDVIKTSLERFKEYYCVKNVDQFIEEYKNAPVTFDEQSFRNWAETQQPSKLKRFDMTQLEVGLKEIIRYQMMIKTDAKNKLEVGATYEYQTVQNIIHHNHMTTACFGSMFKLLFERFTKILKPNVMVMLKKNNDDFEKHLNDYLCCNERYNSIEIDFEKFDKSQLQMCHEMEMAVWEVLGMDAFLLSIWKLGHFDTSATDFIAGIKSRRSGDASTCFANTLISMMAIAHSVELQKMICAYFVGDDSDVVMAADICKDNITRNLSDMFNLSAKLIEKNYAYMCSSFIIPTHEAYIVVPYPVKRVER